MVQRRIRRFDWWCHVRVVRHRYPRQGQVLGRRIDERQQAFPLRTRSDGWQIRGKKRNHRKARLFDNGSKGAGQLSLVEDKVYFGAPHILDQKSCFNPHTIPARDGAARVTIKNLRSLTQNIGTRGARRSGMVLGAMGPRSGRLIACAG